MNCYTLIASLAPTIDSQYTSRPRLIMNTVSSGDSIFIYIINREDKHAAPCSESVQLRGNTSALRPLQQTLTEWEWTGRRCGFETVTFGMICVPTLEKQTSTPWQQQQSQGHVNVHTEAKGRRGGCILKKKKNANEKGHVKSWWVQLC